jgi:hypothetical protein
MTEGRRACLKPNHPVEDPGLHVYNKGCQYSRQQKESRGVYAD